MTPNSAELLNEEESKELDKVLKKNNKKNYKPDNSPILEIGDLVRILSVGRGKQKGKDNYSKMIYKVVDILKSHPEKFTLTRYKLENDAGEVIKKAYNNSQVLKITGDIQKPPVQTVSNIQSIPQEVAELTRIRHTFPTVDLTPINKTRRKKALSKAVQDLNTLANHPNLTPSSSKRNR